ncbi:hypothetical protein D9M72_225620 [compost metagenome]
MNSLTACYVVLLDVLQGVRSEDKPEYLHDPLRGIRLGVKHENKQYMDLVVQWPARRDVL